MLLVVAVWLRCNKRILYWIWHLKFLNVLKISRGGGNTPELPRLQEARAASLAPLVPASGPSPRPWQGLEELGRGGEEEVNRMENLPHTVIIQKVSAYEQQQQQRRQHEVTYEFRLAIVKLSAKYAEHCCFLLLHCVSKKPDPCDILKYFQQIWTNINIFWYR